MKTRLHSGSLTDVRMDAALDAREDWILPSSGFAEAVMAAVHRENEAPEPIPFPWRRALPGLVAGAVALLGCVAVCVYLLASAAAVPAAASGAWLNWQGAMTAWLSRAAFPGIGWLALSLAIPLLCLVILRRLRFLP